MGRGGGSGGEEHPPTALRAAAGSAQPAGVVVDLRLDVVLNSGGASRWRAPVGSGREGSRENITNFTEGWK